MVSRLLVALSSSASHGATESSVATYSSLMGLAAIGLAIVGGIFFGKQYSSDRKEPRRWFSLIGWWRRRQQGYIRQDDTQEESVLTESYVPPPTFGSRSDSEEASIASTSAYYENAPMLCPRPDEELAGLEETPSYEPPPADMEQAPSPELYARNKQIYWNSASSFQSGLESVDSLVESYWDPNDDCDSQVALMPAAAIAPSTAMDQHIQFLQRQVAAYKNDPNPRGLDPPAVAYGYK